MNVRIVFLILASLLVWSQTSHGITSTRVKIIKSKKGRAMIAVPNRQKLPRGRIFRLVEDMGGGDEPIAAGSRNKIIGAGFEFGNYSYETEGSSGDSVTSLALNARFGFNKGKFEYGGFLEFASVDNPGEADTLSQLIGGFFDYNFKANTASRTSVMGARIELGFGQQDASSYASARSVTKIFPAFVYKWFGLSTSYAMIAEAGYEYLSIASDPAITQSGIVMRVGIQNYF